MPTLQVSQCQRCLLRFSYGSELQAHLATDHQPRRVTGRDQSTLAMPPPVSAPAVRSAPTARQAVPASALAQPVRWRWFSTLTLLAALAALLTLVFWPTPTVLVGAALGLLLLISYHWRARIRATLAHHADEGDKHDK